MCMATTRKILTLSQVAEYLKVHKNTVYRLVKRKELPAFKVWHDWRFDLELIDRWRVAQEQAAKVARAEQLLTGWKRDAAAFHTTPSNRFEQP
jgi:excisionase family DNA binding protein